MKAFRRVSAELFERYRHRHPELVVALLELDGADFAGEQLSTREWARRWGVSHKVARRLVREYRTARADWIRYAASREPAAAARAHGGHTRPAETQGKLPLAGTRRARLSPARAHSTRGIAGEIGARGHTFRHDTDTEHRGGAPHPPPVFGMEALGAYLAGRTEAEREAFRAAYRAALAPTARRAAR